jgi:hypothetical protein
MGEESGHQHREPLQSHELTMGEAKRAALRTTLWKGPGEDGLSAAVWRHLWPAVSVRASAAQTAFRLWPQWQGSIRCLLGRPSSQERGEVPLSRGRASSHLGSCMIRHLRWRRSTAGSYFHALLLLILLQLPPFLEVSRVMVIKSSLCYDYRVYHPFFSLSVSKRSVDPKCLMS